jgi:hypothetical protein
MVMDKENLYNMGLSSMNLISFQEVCDNSLSKETVMVFTPKSNIIIAH